MTTVTYSWAEIARTPRLWPLGLLGLLMWLFAMCLWLVLAPLWVPVWLRERGRR